MRCQSIDGEGNTHFSFAPPLKNHTNLNLFSQENPAMLSSQVVMCSVLSLLIAMNPVVVGATICASPMQPISVLESDQDFCVDGPICVGDSSLGKCPGPQEGLEFGAFCDKLSSGVYGCHKLTLLPPQTLRIEDARLEAAEAPNCTILPNLAPVNVKDIGMLCAQRPICAGNVNGNCPATLTKLEDTYRCEFVDNAYQCVL